MKIRSVVTHDTSCSTTTIMRVLASVCIIAAFCVVASLQTSSPFAPCQDGPLPKALRVEGCNSAPCSIYKGTILKAQWDFVANADAQKLRPRVKVKVGPIETWYPYPRQDACKDLSKGECPLEKGDEATYDLNMPISKAYPPVRLNIEFALIDEKNNVQVCFKMDARVTNKRSPRALFKENVVV